MAVVAGVVTIGLLVNMMRPSPPSKLNQVKAPVVSSVETVRSASIVSPPTSMALPPLPDEIKVYLTKAKALADVKREAELAEAKARVRRAEQEGRNSTVKALGLASFPQSKVMTTDVPSESQRRALQVRGITQKGQAKFARVWFNDQWHTVKKGQRIGPYTVTRIQGNRLSVRSAQGAESFYVGG
ncbi:hypothetical protein [Vibrio pectenicida]|uniref:Type IV pilus biogenesis protein PilP n=1 Tax=Vibrio pectenicida TaxID=62763 RepID=A0A427U4X9_9VIBR|nr:hypothetical protein [Vibrio pectenicida]RSD31739.1 hypothetical protein EJA03_07380 [Vibrio pectenicida]